MSECCIAGCFNRPTKERTLKFYTIPTANSVRPFKVNRRRLWLEAIEKANGSVADLSFDSRICSAHFISGQFSLDNSNPDFVPSVFPNLQRLKPSKGTRLRPCTPSKASYVKVKKKTPRTRKKPLEEVHLLNNTVLMETDQCEEEKQTATSSTLTEDEVVLQEEDEIKLSSVLGTADLSPPKKPILLLTSVVDTSGGFRCEVCNSSFTDGSVLAKHKELHDQEMSGEEKCPTPSEVCERRTNIESDVSDRQIGVADPWFKCNMCDRSFPTIHNLKRHKLLHVRDARKCTQCGTLFCKRHNHVLFRPQISTETNFEEDTVTGDTLNVPSENQSPESSYSDDLEFNENTINEAGEPTLAKEEQCKASTAVRPKPGPAFTCKPKKPDLLASFVSFISTSTAQPQPSKAIQPKKRPSTDLRATQPVPEPSTSLNAVKVFNNSSAKPEKSYTFIATTSKPGSSPVKTATSPNSQLRHSIKIPLVKQSTAALSVSKPLPPDVLKAFMSFICKTESTRSSVPRLITFRQTEDPIATPPKPGASTTFVPDMATTPAMQTKLTHKRHASAMAGYVHGSRPPSPEPILDKRRRGQWEASSLHHPRDFVQPHLPQTPVLPPALQMFSPQYLTSAMLDVERNYRYILSKV